MLVFLIITLISKLTQCPVLASPIYPPNATQPSIRSNSKSSDKWTESGWFKTQADIVSITISCPSRFAQLVYSPVMYSMISIHGQALLRRDWHSEHRSEFLLTQLVRISSLSPLVEGLSLDLVLAVQNMEASGTIDKDQAIEFSALEGSLSMMSKGTALQIERLRISLTGWVCSS